MPTQFCFTQQDTSFSGQNAAIVAKQGTSETIAPTGSNQQTTISAGAGQKICRVATDVAVYVEFGSDPDATNNAGGRILLLAGTTDYFAVESGDNGAVVTA